MLKIWVLLGMILTITLGVNTQVSASVTEYSTSCDIFNCSTILKTSFNIPPTFIGNTYTLDQLPETAIKKHFGDVKDLVIFVQDKNTIELSGWIDGSTQNKWGIILLGDTSHENSTWWNSSFYQCQNITITDNAGLGDQTGYPVLLNITHNINMSAGFEDIRLVDTFCYNNGTEYYYYIEHNVTSAYADTWVRANFSNSTNSTIGLYFFNTTPVVSKSNGTLTFDKYDNFNTLANLILDSNPVFQHGSVHLNTSIVKKGDWSAQQTRDSATYIAHYLDMGNQTTDFMVNIWVYLDYNPVSHHHSYILNGNPTHSGGDQLTLVDRSVANWSYYNGTADIDLMIPFNLNQWYRLVIKDVDFTADTFDLYINGTKAGDDLPMRNPRDWIQYFELTMSDANGQALVDEFWVGKHIEPEPTITFGGTIFAPTTTTTTLSGYFNVQIPESTLISMNWLIALAIFIMACVFIALKS